MSLMNPINTPVAVRYEHTTFTNSLLQLQLSVIDMAEEVHKQPPSRKRTVFKIVGIVSVLLVAGALGVLLRWAIVKHNATPKRDPKALPVIIEDVQNLRISGNDAQAQQKIEDALKSSKTSDKERYMLYIQRGNIAADKDDHQGAIAGYKQAEAVMSTYEVSHLLAFEYEASGDNAKAIEYYQKSIDLLPKNPLRSEQAATYQQKIKDLGGQ